MIHLRAIFLAALFLVPGMLFAAPTISTTSPLTVGTLGTAYAQTFTAAGAPAPYTCRRTRSGGRNSPLPGSSASSRPPDALNISLQRESLPRRIGLAELVPQARGIPR